MSQNNQNISEEEKKVRENEQNKIIALEKASKPLWITKKFVEKPCLVIIVCSIVFIICTILTVALDLLGQSDESDREWLVWSDEKVQNLDLWTEAEEIFKEKSADQDVPERSQEIDDWATMLILECYEDCDNVLTYSRVEKLRQAENKIKGLKSFGDFCLATTNDSSCSEDSFVSITNLLTSDQLSNGIQSSELSQVLNQILDSEDVYDQYSYLFGNKFKKTNKKSHILRSMFNFGGPIKVNGKLKKNRYDDEDGQLKEFQDFSQEMIDVIDELNKGIKDEGLEIILFSEEILDIKKDDIVGNDFLWAFASILFVWIYLTFHLQSFFLSCFSMLNIIMSFPITLVLVRGVFQVSYFNSLQILTIFIVLGIAADDVFVFQDAWKQTAHYSVLAGDLNKRMAVTFKRASKAMLATSSTTSAAFLATGFSSLMPISSFGIFAGILVPVNYILVITFYPAILIVYENHIAKFSCCPCLKKNKKTANDFSSGFNKNQDNQETQQQQQQVIKVDIPDYMENSESNNNNSQQQQQQQQQKQQEENSEKKDLSKVEKFFGNQFNEFIVKGKYIILGVFAIWTGIAIWRATKLGPQTEPDKWLPDHYDMQRAVNYIQAEFIQSGESDQVITNILLFGLDHMDTDGTTAWEPDNAGTLIFDKAFDLSSEQNQQYLHDFCISLQSSSLVLDGKIECFMLDFKKFVTNNDQNPNEFPVEQSQFITKLKEFTQDPLGQRSYLSSQIGIYNNKLNHAAIFATSIGDPLGGYKTLEPLYDRWQKYVEDYNKNAPKGINKMVQTSGTWAWMVSQKAFVLQGFGGMFISLAFAFIVLILSTHNIVVSIYSIVSITGIVVSVVTVMELSGWQMGIAESITIVILIGFCVDYVVHLANHYVESSYSDKYKRMQESLQEIGISILSGAITTIGSGLFLIFAISTIFNKFAILIISTICFSVLYALFFFVSLMHAFGPEGECGNLLVLIKKLKTRGCKISNEKEEAKKENKT